MKRIAYILLLLLAVGNLQAETRRDVKEMPNELRIGWGDMLFESLMWHNPKSVVQTMPTSYSYTYQEDFRHHQHLFLEYQHRFNYWFGLGAMVDLGEVDWQNVTRNGQGVEIARDPGHYFYNVTIMPTFRFTYFHHENVNLYSGLGLGLVINGGTEQNAFGNRTETGFAANFTVLGISANYKRWFASVEFGGLYGLRNANTIYMASSRIFSASIGARF
ncbi:MAG: hypothetical protein IKG86_00380 [Paludibacteraceae bacterium]|nr:hypothetical protein [Paludibacteraceae bacterium]